MVTGMLEPIACAFKLYGFFPCKILGCCLLQRLAISLTLTFHFHQLRQDTSCHFWVCHLISDHVFLLPCSTSQPTQTSGDKETYPILHISALSSSHQWSIPVDVWLPIAPDFTSGPIGEEGCHSQCHHNHEPTNHCNCLGKTKLYP